MPRKSASRIPFTRKHVKMSTEEFAEKLRKNMTQAERTLWKLLRKRMKLWGVEFEPQAVVGGYIPDFYCHEAKLVVEVDGKIHLKPGIRAKDRRRTRKLNKMGVQVIRFTNEQVIHRVYDVVRAIEFVVDQQLRR